MPDVPSPAFQLGFGGQFAVKQQIGGFEVGAFFGELFDGVAAITQDSFVAVDVSDAADAGSSVVVGGVVAHHAEIGGVGFNLAEIHGPDRAMGNGEVVALAGAIVGDGNRLARRGSAVGFLGGFGSGAGIHRTNLVTHNYTAKRESAETRGEGW